MAPGKMLHPRGGSLSPTSRPYDTSVIKVGGEVFDKDGYRMDVTVWFRHRNEVLYYLDSGGSVHGPMDQKHSTRLGNISRNGQLIPGSRYYLGDGASYPRTLRRQSESGAWDMKSEMRSYQTTDTFRGRTYSESRRPFDSSSQRPYYRTTALHTVSATSPPSHHISRWSSMQSAGTQGLWRGASSSAGRYATTLTRQHIKRHRDPVEMLVKHPPSIGASKVDLVSIDNRRSSSPQLHYTTTLEMDTSTERERRLQDELMSTRRELQELKRSRSLTGDHHLLSPSKQNLKSTSTQYLNEGTWTTHTLKKNDGLPCGARIATRPYRAVSQTNISGRQPMARNQWISESNLRTTTTYKQPPMYTNYSAHRENMRKMEEQSRTAEDWMSNRHLEEAKSATGTEVLEEMETITLQPIGRGVHDLEPTGSIARSFRANTPTGTFYSPPSAQISRPHSSAAYMYPYTPGPSRQVRSDISHLANARSEVNMVASQPLLTGTTNRNRVESMSSEVASYSTKRFNQSRTSERYVGAYNSHSARPSPAPLSTSGRIQSPSFFSHQRKSRSATPARDLISPLSDGRIAYRESPITSRYASLAFTSGPDQSDGYRTIATTNLHREVHTSGAPSPYAGAHHSAFYDSSSRGMDSRYRTVTNQSETQWRGVESGSVSGVSGHADMVDSNQGLLRQVKDTFMNWYLPEKTREEVNTLLRDKEPGSFIIRNSISCVNSFSLGLKIPPNSPHVQTRPDDFKTGFVRHFIIGTVPMNDGRGDGLQLCGFVNQPVFPSLVDFVHHHILQPGPFPCPLRLPVPMGQGSVVPIQQGRTTYATQTSVSGVASSAGMVGSPPGGGGDGIAADMLYLGQVEVDRLENAVAVRQAITQLLSQAANNPAGLPKRCEVLIKAIPNDGITFVDKTKRTMLRKHIKPSQLLWCGIDPENRTFPDPELRARGMPSAKTFGIVARRQHFFMHENVVYVFSELDPTQSAINLCHYINGVFHTH